MKSAPRLVACLVLAATACAGDDDGTAGDGATTETTVPASAITPEEVGELTEAWRVDRQLGVTGQPTVRDGTVYFGNRAGSATAVDLGTGEVVWQTLVAADASVTLDAAALVTYADGVVYRPSVPGVLQAFDAESGRELWSSEPGGDMGAGVRVEDGWVLVPHGFWFFGGQSDLPGGVVAYRLPD